MKRDKTTKKELLYSLMIPKQNSKGNAKEPGFLTQRDSEKIDESFKNYVVFSYKYFDKETAPFNCGGTSVPWFISCTSTLNKVSGMKIEELYKEQGKRKGLRFHPIDWQKVPYKFNFNETLMEQIADRSYQLSISKARGRIHGFILENVFYIVWFDPDHQLYLMKDHGGDQLFKSPHDEYELLALEYDKLQKAYSDLEKEYNDCLECVTTPDQ
jgi:hypothetical protein